MKTLLFILSFGAIALTSCSKPAAQTTAVIPLKGDLIAVTAKDADWVASQKAVYPLTTCTVSGDKLGGDMGPAQEYIWREAGKPDRLVMFCCNDCPPDFRKDPAKYLKMIDDAAAKKKA